MGGPYAMDLHFIEFLNQKGVVPLDVCLSGSMEILGRVIFSLYHFSGRAFTKYGKACRGLQQRIGLILPLWSWDKFYGFEGEGAKFECMYILNNLF